MRHALLVLYQIIGSQNEWAGLQTEGSATDKNLYGIPEYGNPPIEFYGFSGILWIPMDFHDSLDSHEMLWILIEIMNSL